MNTALKLNVLTLRENGALIEESIEPLGPVVKIEKVTPTHQVPLALGQVLDLARRCGESVSLVTCRKTGVPENKDGSHHQHFLVLQSVSVPMTGVTF